MNRLALIAKIAFSALLLWLISQRIDFGETFENAAAFSAAGLAGFGLLLLIQQAIASGRLSLVMATLKERLSLKEAVPVSLVGLFFSQTFLSFLGGDAARLWELKREGIGIRNAASGVLLDRLTGIIANHLLILAFLPWSFALMDSPLKRTVLLAVALGGAAAIAMLFVFAFLRGRVGLEKKLTARLKAVAVIPLLLDLVSVLRVSFTAPLKTLGAVALGLAVNVLNAAMIYVLFADLGIQVSLFACILVVPLVMELAMIPITVAGWGVREGLMVVAFGLMGVQAGPAFLVSVLFGALSVLFSLVGCGVWLARRPAGRVEAETPSE